MKAAVDQVTKDLGEVALVEASMKEKPWDTQAMIKFVHERAKEVIDLKDETFNSWCSLTRDKTIGTKTTEEINAKAKGAEVEAKQLNTKMKVFMRDVLSEFRSK